MASSNTPSKIIFFFTFKNLNFFEKKKLSQKREKSYFFKMSKKLFHLNLFSRPYVGNLFRMFYIINAAKFTHFEKSAKNAFLVNWKKWKKGEKGSSKWNHPKVALTNCHYFVNSDPHAKIYENPTWSFSEQISFSGFLVVLISLLYL